MLGQPSACAASRALIRSEASRSDAALTEAAASASLARAAVRDGIRAAVGGARLRVRATCRSTVLANVPDGAECSREEIFGPVVTIETLASEEEAIARANDVPFGRAASVWTEDARRSHDAASGIAAGAVWANSAPPGAGQ